MTIKTATPKDYNTLAKWLIEKKFTGSTKEWLKNRKYTIQGIRFQYATLDAVVYAISPSNMPEVRDETEDIPF